VKTAFFIALGCAVLLALAPVFLALFLMARVTDLREEFDNGETPTDDGHLPPAA
jgi:hypothetical protein